MAGGLRCWPTSAASSSASSHRGGWASSSRPFTSSGNAASPAHSPLPAVLADRLFDLLALLVTGALALLALSSLAATDALGLAAALVLLVVPFLLFLNPAVYGWVQRRAQRWRRFGERLFGARWLTEVRHSLRRLSPLALTASLLLTALAYGVYYGQC